MTSRSIAVAMAAICSLFVFGCGESSKMPKAIVVKGKVTVDKVPLDSGKIAFDEGPTVPVVELDIKNGAYEGPVTVGTKTIRISAYRVGKAPQGMAGMPGYEQGVQENYIPAKYNAASKEVRDIKEGGPKEFDFEVSKK